MSKMIEFIKDSKKVGSLTIENKSDTVSLYFYGDIVDDSWWGAEGEEQSPANVRNSLSEIDDNAALDIHINSGGGSVFGGYAIYNMLKAHKGRKIVHIDGLAASIASVIALVGDEVYMPKNAFLMIHKPANIMFGMYNSDELRKTADILDKIEESLLTVYEENKRENTDIEHIRELVSAETWLTADEAAELFNIIIDDAVEMAASDSEYFERYKNVPDNFKKCTITDGETKKSFDINDYREVIASFVDDCLKNRSEQEKNERKNKILSDLDNICKELGVEVGG